jgi:hypothetical protein
VSLIDTYRKSEADALLATKQAASPTLTTYASTGIGFRNRIINGDMRIDQRNAGASVTPASTDYTLDRFRLFCTVGSKLSVQQVVDAPAGFAYSAKITVASSYSPSSSEQFFFGTSFEANNIGDLSFGTASAKTATLSFWVKSSVTGTYSASWTNNSGDRSYVQSFTIDSANTWEQKTITIVGDTTGTWTNYGNTRNSFLQIGLGAGSNFYGTAGSWQSGNLRQTSGSTNFVSQANNSTFYITGVQLEAGSVASPFERRDYGREEIMCKRYYQKIGGAIANDFQVYGYTPSGIYAKQSVVYSVTMRSSPTATKVGTWTNANLNSTTFYAGTNSMLVELGSTAANVACSTSTVDSTTYISLSAEL